MELTSLRYFLCVARNLSFSRAAEQLYISQPTLSYHISNLEKELGVPLFIRDKRQLILTEAGGILAEEAAQACEHVDQACQRIASLTDLSDSLRFGFLELLITPCFNLFVAPFLNSNPELHGVLERAGWLLMSSLLKDQYDFIFTRQCMIDLHAPQGQLHSHTLMKDSFSIAVPSSHPCAQGDSISDLTPLNGSKLLMVDKYIAGNVYDPLLKSILPTFGFHSTAPDYIVHNMDELLSQVAAGRGFSILPFYTTISMPFHGVKLLRLEGIDCSDADVSLAWDPQKMTPTKRKFLDYILEHFPEPL